MMLQSRKLTNDSTVRYHKCMGHSIHSESANLSVDSSLEYWLSSNVNGGIHQDSHQLDAVRVIRVNRDQKQKCWQCTAELSRPNSVDSHCRCVVRQFWFSTNSPRQMPISRRFHRRNPLLLALKKSVHTTVTWTNLKLWQMIEQIWIIGQ
jgi:hypothetical protein